MTTLTATTARKAASAALALILTAAAWSMAPQPAEAATHDTHELEEVAFTYQKIQRHSDVAIEEVVLSNEGIDVDGESTDGLTNGEHYEEAAMLINDPYYTSRSV